MQFVKALLRMLTGLLLHGSLLLLIISLCFTFLFGDKEVVKDALLESRVYEKIIPSIIDDNRLVNDGKLGILPLDDPRLQEIANESFSYSVIKTNGEYFIDQLYGWLNGDTDELKFEINLNSRKDVFINNISTYGANRLVELPLCTNENINSITVFDLTCRPENVPLEFVKNRVSEDLYASDFFQDIRITEKDLPKTQSGELLHEELSFVPTINQIFKKGVWLFGLMFVLAAALFVSVRKPYRKGFKLLGRDLFSNGVTFIFMTLIFGFVLPLLTNSLSIEGSKTVTLMNNVTDVLVRRFDILIINIAVQIIAVAILIMAIERISRPTNTFSGLSKKSGITSSQPRKTSKPSQSSNKLPPLQSSETKKQKKLHKQLPKKYRGSGL